MGCVRSVSPFRILALFLDSGRAVCDVEANIAFYSLIDANTNPHVNI